MSHHHHEHGEHCHHDHTDKHQEEIEKKIKELPLNVRVKAVALYNYTKKKENLDDELEKAIRKLQRDFDVKALTLYDSQQQIIAGKRPPTKEELEKAETYGASQFQDESLQNSEPISNYWGQALINCESIQQRFNPDGKNEKDEEVLKHLQSVQVEYVADSEDFIIRFTFAPNDYFTNTDLTKKFFFRAPGTSKHQEEEDFPIKTEGTEIHWKEGKDITKKVVEKKQKNKKTGASRTVKKTVDAPSFFNFFRSVNLEVKEQLDEEAQEEIDVKMEDDFEVGRTIVDELIPFSLEYYLGINPEQDEEDFEDDDDGDDDKEEDKDTEGDESDDDKKKKKEKSKRKKSGNDDKKEASGAQKADCKQQ